jgi:hypothetical protein
MGLTETRSPGTAAPRPEKKASDLVPRRVMTGRPNPEQMEAAPTTSLPTEGPAV